jgi:hypothetical protein
LTQRQSAGTNPETLLFQLKTFVKDGMIESKKPILAGLLYFFAATSFIAQAESSLRSGSGGHSPEEAEACEATASELLCRDLLNSIEIGIIA